MNEDINSIKLKFSCSQNWDDMLDTNEGKFCTGCNKTVYDLTEKKSADFLKLLSEQNHSICGRFRADQMTQEPIKRKIWKKWVVAAMVFIGLGSLTQQADAQTKKDKKPAASSPENSSTRRMLLGEPCVYIEDPQTRTGLNAVDKYLTREFHGAFAPNGTLTISFNIDKDGKLKNITANNKFPDGVNDSVSKEVLRLLATAPKLINYKQTPENTGQVYFSTLSFRAGKIVGSQRM